MDKVLYFRSSPDPLILDEEQREARRKGIFRHGILRINLSLSLCVFVARIESLKKGSGVMVVRGRTLPELTPNRSGGHWSGRSELSTVLIKVSKQFSLFLCCHS